MIPERPLPCSSEFSSADEYVDGLLDFVTTTPLFQHLCGGVHILDFFTSDPGLFRTIFPSEWQEFILQCDTMALLDLLMRDDIQRVREAARTETTLDTEAQRTILGKYGTPHFPPESLVDYIAQIRRFSLARDFTPRYGSPKSTLPRHIAVGMKQKKIHEVANFAQYIDGLSKDIREKYQVDVSHLIDFGSGQNYLGRALASEPYHRNVIAVECKGDNISGARDLDVMAGLASRPIIMRNKKLWQQQVDEMTPEDQLDDKARRRLLKAQVKREEAQKEKSTTDNTDSAASIDTSKSIIRDEITPTAELRPRKQLGAQATYTREKGKGYIEYVEGRLENGDLSHLMDKLQSLQVEGEVEEEEEDEEENHYHGSLDGVCETHDDTKSQCLAMDRTKITSPREVGLMAVSIHSCGNLSHYGIRSLILNPAVKAVAIVGCCYNLMTEKLGPPKRNAQNTALRPSLQALNGRIVRESSRYDPEGFPLSQRLTEYQNEGVRLNITARMMACQAPYKWTESESDQFFRRHFYRAILQKIFLDKGVVSRVYHGDDGETNGEKKTVEPSTSDATKTHPFNMSTNPVIIGSLRKNCYHSLEGYIRGAIDKLTTNREYSQYAEIVAQRMADMSEEEIADYGTAFRDRFRELSATWSLIAFSAGVVESLIVTDRWQYLREQRDVVQHTWVETVFNYDLSPRNLVIVGVKAQQPSK